ncbi:hypothetical protein AB4305_25320 [Nocardia sp. 2YAB30]
MPGGSSNHTQPAIAVERRDQHRAAPPALFGFTRASEYRIRLSIDVPDGALMALSLDSEQLPSGTVRYAPPFGI